jgi:hypothetical protein
MNSARFSQDLATNAGLGLVLSMAGIAMGVAALFVAGVAWARQRDRSVSPKAPLVAGAGTLLWMVLWAAIAQTGILRNFDTRPPPMMLMMAITIGLAIYVGSSSLGATLSRSLPLAALVGAQAFRLPLELTMHHAAAEGVMPTVMSYSGYNFDIVTGSSAALVGLWLHFGKPPLWLVALWNAVGFGLLVAIGAIAVAATPLFAAFGPDQINLWVAYFPFVWLPVVMVWAALLGHILVFRRLLAEYGARSATRAIAS